MSICDRLSRTWVIRLCTITAFALLLQLAGVALATAQGVDPPTVSLNLDPGDSSTVTKTVETPAVAPKLDVMFLADTTGSMGSTLGNVSANASEILTEIQAAADDARFAAGDYKDFPYDPYAFRLCSAMTDDTTATTNCINSWFASGGGDTPEGQLYALHRIATNEAGVNYRSDAQRILVWFGDAPGHDPVCTAVSDDPHGDITQATVTADLVAAGIRVIAISVTSGAGGLDLDPSDMSGDYFDCDTQGGSAGQASSIAAATGGAYFADVPPSEVTGAILEGISSVSMTVAPEPQADCDPELVITYNTASQTVESGSTATFQETIGVASGAADGTYTCTVDFLLDGSSAGSAFQQSITVVVETNEAPDAEDDSASTTLNTSVTIDLLGNDSDPDGDSLSITDIGLASNGTVVDNGDGTVTYTPNTDFTGTDSFEYTISDPDGLTDIATVTVDVANQPPVAVDDSAAAMSGETVIIDVLFNDVDPDAGDVVSLNTVDTTSALGGTISVNVDGTLSYSAPGVGGTDTFSYTIVDSAGATATAMVTVIVEAVVVNQPPDCSAATPSVAVIWPPNHQFVAIDILGVTDPDGDPITITIDSIYQDEPIDSTGDGAFVPDASGVGTSQAQVRAERAGTKQTGGDGRFYHIFYTATDGNGSSCSGEVVVIVPFSQGANQTPVDQGAIYDSTS